MLNSYITLSLADDSSSAIKATQKAVLKTETFQIISKKIYTTVQKELDIDKEVINIVGPALLMGLSGNIGTYKIKKFSATYGYATIRPDVNYSLKDKDASVTLAIGVPLD